jgi:hypothetical protein
LLALWRGVTRGTSFSGREMRSERDITTGNCRLGGRNTDTQHCSRGCAGCPIPGHAVSDFQTLSIFRHVNGCCSSLEKLRFFPVSCRVSPGQRSSGPGCVRRPVREILPARRAMFHVEHFGNWRQQARLSLPAELTRFRHGPCARELVSPRSLPRGETVTRGPFASYATAQLTGTFVPRRVVLHPWETG